MPSLVLNMKLAASIDHWGFRLTFAMTFLMHLRRHWAGVTSCFKSITVHNYRPESTGMVLVVLIRMMNRRRAQRAVILVCQEAEHCGGSKLTYVSDVPAYPCTEGSRHALPLPSYLSTRPGFQCFYIPCIMNATLRSCLDHVVQPEVVIVPQS